MAFLLKKEDFPLFINLLSKSYDVYAPIRNRDIMVYAKVGSAKDIDLSKNTYYSPKKFFLPAKENLFEYRKKRSLLGGEKESIKTDLDAQKQVVFGMRMCDVHGIRKLDSFFLGETADPYYKAKRDNTFIIALKCDAEENDNCFCSSFENKDEGYDLFLQRSVEGFIVDVKTEKGKQLIDKKIFKATSAEASKTLPDCEKKLAHKSVPLESKNWQKHSEKCLSCCACNIVCPTCGCFDIHDTPNLDLKTGVRTRVWDFCQSPDYTRVAGNHIFRQSVLGRYKHRLLCKFDYFKNNYGEETCTGCGRCITVCPTDVCDIPKVMSDING